MSIGSRALPLLFAAAAAALRAAADEPEEIVLEHDDTVIERSVRIKPGTYRIADANLDGIVRIRGNGLTVDFSGAVIDGSAPGDEPDEFLGRGIVAEGCRDLTIKNAVVRGTKVALYFRECDGLTVTDCDVSRNWRQRLKSTPRAEDGADWLFGHENDKDEWLRYGAGIWVARSKGVTLARIRARNGQNGICLSRVDDSFVYDSDLCFMSGWGIALWRSCRNEISHNRLDWCIRGYSHGVYSRGQDSAGILVYEQCHDNVFAFNSATHGGDGFFLYAGNETLQRTGEGGCNRNLLYQNDFSHAAANGIEATFSAGNRFVENVLDECDHGIWAGYSYDTTMARNTIRDCNHGISIEHGHANRILDNRFERSGVGVNLWWNPNEEFKRTAYGGKQDTLSHGYTIAGNRFAGDKTAIRLGRTSNVQVGRNEIHAEIALESDGCEKLAADGLEGRVVGPAPEQARIEVEPFLLDPPKTRGTLAAFLPAGAVRGRKFIFVDEWGPYDYTDLRVFPNPLTAWGGGEVHLLGPGGEYRITEVTSGVEVAPAAGRLPAIVRVTTAREGLTPFEFRVESAGKSATASGLLCRGRWRVHVFAWEPQGPQKPPKDWAAVVAGKPVDEFEREQIEFVDRPSQRSPFDHYGTLAEAELDLEAGKYLVRTVSDDGVRVFVDGQAVIDNWTWHGPTEDRAEVDLAKGKHAIRVEHFEIDGYATLEFALEPMK